MLRKINLIESKEEFVLAFIGASGNYRCLILRLADVCNTSPNSKLTLSFEKLNSFPRCTKMIGGRAGTRTQVRLSRNTLFAFLKTPLSLPGKHFHDRSDLCKVLGAHLGFSPDSLLPLSPGTVQHMSTFSGPISAPPLRCPLDDLSSYLTRKTENIWHKLDLNFLILNLTFSLCLYPSSCFISWHFCGNKM